MKTTTWFLGIIAAAGVCASIYLGMRLAASRDELVQSYEGRIADAKRIRELAQEIRRLQDAAHPPAPGPQAAPPDAARPSANTARYADVAESGPRMPPGLPGERPGNFGNGSADANARRLQQEIRLRRLYADMPAALDLDPAQADKLFDLLADSRVAEFNDQRGYQGDPVGRQSVEAAAREQRDAAIETLLGPDKAAEFQSFEKSIPARMQVNRIGESMAAANVPLTAAQRTSLIAAVAAEQQAGPPPQRPADGSSDSGYETKFLDWQADYSRRVQARVEPLLTAEQARQYRDAVQMQNARRAEQRARAEARRNETPRP
jgi:hypothetical protein